MNKANLGFINLYKFIGAIIIACFLHYRVLLLEMFQDSYPEANGLLTFLMSDSSNYIVELFFMLSGLLFAYTYKERIELQKLTFADFFDKRLKRLMPLTITTTVVMFFFRVFLEKITGLEFYPGSVSINELINSMVLVNSTLCNVRINPSGWYIAKLLVCYIVAYFLARQHRNLGKITFMIPIVLGVIIRNTGIDYPFLELHMSRAYIAFFLGIILYSVIGYLKNNLKPMLIIIGGVLVGGFPILFKWYVTDWNMIATTIFFPALVIIGYFSKTINFIGGLKISRYLGEISFDIYLWNCPILVIMAVLHYQCGVQINTGKFVYILIILHIIVGCVSNWTGKKIKQRWKIKNYDRDNPSFKSA